MVGIRFIIASIILGVMVFVTIILNQREGMNKLRRKLNNRIKSVVHLKRKITESECENRNLYLEWM